MNSYTTEFFSLCPANNVRIKYCLTIQIAHAIMVEDIIDEVTLHHRGYHEEIADQIHRTFGGRQVLVADHHGVKIETVRE
jgi:hypothetical protein